MRAVGDVLGYTVMETDFTTSISVGGVDEVRPVFIIRGLKERLGSPVLTSVEDCERYILEERAGREDAEAGERFRATLRPHGGSLQVIVPAKVARRLGLDAGDEAEIVIRRARRRARCEDAPPPGQGATASPGYKGRGSAGPRASRPDGKACQAAASLRSELMPAIRAGGMAGQGVTPHKRIGSFFLFFLLFRGGSEMRCEEERSIDAYVAMLARRGRKSLTIDGVRRGCRRCEALAGKRPEEVGAEDAARVQARLLARHKESTARTYLEDYGGYLEWATGRNAVRQARLLWNGRADVERVWITAEDYARLYAAATPRERAMLALGATMGLRREEIMTLTMDRIGGGVVVVHGKGHGPRGAVAELPMSEGVRRALAEWMPERERVLREHGRECDRLIVSWCGKAMDKGTMDDVMERLSGRCGVKATPHSLRRLYATTMADAGVDLDTMARMMRHASPSTTCAYYLKADPRRMAEALAKVDEALATARRYAWHICYA